MGPRERIARISERLAAAGVEGARGEAWLLFAAAIGAERPALMAGAGVTRLNSEQEAALEALVRRRE
ncbi:MAG TPA: hypothetical protein VFZ10_03825, partial [Geminicoccaceae bacterium]